MAPYRGDNKPPLEVVVLTFKEVARYFVQMRENGEYSPSDDELQHIESVLQLLNVMDKEHRFETEINERGAGREVRKMSEWLTRVINENQAIGRAEGEFSMLVNLVRKNLLSVKDAAEQAGMTETAFCQKAGISLRQ